MRKILYLWAFTIVFFWGWHFVSYYDLGPTFFFSRGFHDHMYGIYANILQIPASEVPIKVAWVFVIDTLIVFAIAALRWYKHWLPQSWGWTRQKLGLQKRNSADDDITERGDGRVRPAE